MSLTADLRILWHLAFAKVSGDTHADRLEQFYGVQADAYDDFRRRLLHGREEMMRSLPMADGARAVDMGGGTGSNFESLGEGVKKFSEITVLDLSPSLLKVADERIRRNGWTNARTVCADATTYEPAGGPVDLVTFSYSLTMIPDWFRCIDRAYEILKPGGLIGVADFYVSRKWPAAGMANHSTLRRSFLQTWFSWDNVFPNPDHLPYLQSKFEPVVLRERMGKVPYMLGFKAPYYIFVGRKK